MTLGRLPQLDFSSGEWRAVARHLIPPDGAYSLSNCLLDDDGSVYRRGGASYLSTSAFGTGLTGLWDGQLLPGARTVIANTADFGVLDAAEAPLNLGLAGLAQPRRMVELAHTLFIPGGTIYAGSRKTADYSTGTVSVTNGSKTVTGASTVWNANADAGMLFQRGTGTRFYPVETINSDTSLTLRDPYEGATLSGQTYTLQKLSTLAAPYRISNQYVVAGNRMWSLEGHKAYFSAFDNPHSWAVDDYHEFTEELLGGEGLGDRLLLFSTDGVYQISNLAYDLTDDFGNVQHRVEQVTSDIILWGHEGITGYAGGLVVPATDHVWLVDGIGQPVPLTRSVASDYREYVEAGQRPGVPAVFRSHLFLPVLSVANDPIDFLVCRLDRPTSSPVGTVWPWAHWEGYAAHLSALTVRAGGSGASRSPKLLAGSLKSSARVANLTPCFGPEVANGSDPDGTVHDWSVVTRDFPTGNGFNENTVRRLRVRYELVADTGTPDIAADQNPGALDTPPVGQALWDAANWDVAVWADEDPEDVAQWASLPGTAPPDDGRGAFIWHVNARSRYMRFRLRSSKSAKRLALRSLEVFARESMKD